MTKKILGHVELEWTCKRCGTKNSGLQKTCTTCGGPMTTGDKFELPEEQKLIDDKEKLEAAKKGADIHCPYCGTRNPAATETCIQCGGDLKDAAIREAGQVLGAHTTAPVPEIACPYCSAQIKANSKRCPVCGGDLVKEVEKPIATAPVPKKLPIWVMVAAGALLLLCLCGFVAFALRGAQTDELRATVQSVSWQRSLEILEVLPQTYSDWEDSLPAEAEDITCEDSYRGSSSVAAPKSTEVCGTPYTVDQGSGVGEVVQDCEYLVYDSYCEFTVLEWQVVSQPSVQGSGSLPYWPEVSLESGQRQGNTSETYVVRFVADGISYDYVVSDPETFAMFTEGSEWTIVVDGFGQISEVTP